MIDSTRWLIARPVSWRFRSWNQPSSLHVVLSHVRQGAGEPLVLVHGIGSHLGMWSPVLARLAAERDVIAVDVPGFGASPAAAGAPTIAALTDAVAELIAELGVRRPHVAGNSMGGAIALELGRSGRARSVTCLSPIGFARGREGAYALAVLRTSRLTATRLRPLLPLVYATAVGRTLSAAQIFGRPWRLSADDLVAQTDALIDGRGFDATGPYVRDYRWDNGDLDVPVTVAWGEHDRVLIPRQARRARRAMPKARHVWLSGCGHVPTWDDPDQVAGVILAGSRDD